MILISKSDRDALDRVGLLTYKKTGKNPQDANFIVTNRQSKSSSKRYYVSETPEVMLFLEKYDGMNLQKIGNHQLQKLLDSGSLTEEKIQRSGEYVPGAIAYIDRSGQCRIKKVATLMIELKLWKSNSKKYKTSTTDNNTDSVTNKNN